MKKKIRQELEKQLDMSDNEFNEEMKKERETEEGKDGDSLINNNLENIESKLLEEKTIDVNLSGLNLEK